MLSICVFGVVVVCLPRPMKGMGRLQFSDLFTEMPVAPQADGVDGHLIVLVINDSDQSTTVSFFTLRMTYYIYKVSFLCVHFHKCSCVFVVDMVACMRSLIFFLMSIYVIAMSSKYEVSSSRC